MRLPTGRTVIAATGVHGTLTTLVVVITWAFDLAAGIVIGFLALNVLVALTCIAMARLADERGEIAVREAFRMGARLSGLLDIGIRRNDLKAIIREAAQAPSPQLKSPSRG